MDVCRCYICALLLVPIWMQGAHKWDDAVRVASAAHHPRAEGLKAQRMEWLMVTGQLQRAGQVRVWLNLSAANPRQNAYEGAPYTHSLNWGPYRARQPWPPAGCLQAQ